MNSNNEIQTLIRERSVDISGSISSVFKKFEQISEKYLIVQDREHFLGLLSRTALRCACLNARVALTEDLPLSAVSPALCQHFIYDFEEDKNILADAGSDYVPVLNRRNQIVDLRMKQSAGDREKLPIRQLTKDDLPILNQFFDQMGGESRAFFNRNDGNRKFLVKTLSEENNTNTIVYGAINSHGEIAGLCFLIDLNTGVPWVGIAVAEDWKGHHLGRSLLAHLDTFAQSRGYGALMLITAVSNQRGQGLYERMGYCKLGTHSSGEFLYIKRYIRAESMN